MTNARSVALVICSRRTEAEAQAGGLMYHWAVYTVRFEKSIYVLHCFQKKSPRGIKTAQPDVELIDHRLKAAREDYETRYGTR